MLWGFPSALLTEFWLILTFDFIIFNETVKQAEMLQCYRYMSKKVLKNLFFNVIILIVPNIANFTAVRL